MKRYLLLPCLLWLTLCAFPQEYLRLMSYNVRNAKGLDGKHDIQRVANVILTARPDVVAIQEVDSMSIRYYRYVLGELAMRTGMHASFAPALHLGIGKYGVGVLSRERPLSITRVKLPGKREKRVALIVEFEDYFFCSTHLSLTLKDRMRSLDIIREYAKESTKPFFLAGDLNDLPDSKFIACLKNDYEILNDVDEPTFPADNPNRTIDYITSWKSGEEHIATVLSQTIDERVASDHRPVMVTLRRAVCPDSILSAGVYLQNSVNGVSASWVTNVSAHSWVEYSLGDTAELQTVTAYPIYHDGTVHRADIAGLASGDTLHYRICSQETLGKDKVGHTAKSDFRMFVVP